MNKRTLQVGIDRRIRLEWLDYVANLLLAGSDEVTVRTELERLLTPVFPSSSLTIRGSLSKTLTVLSRIWVRVHRDICPLRDAGLELLQAADTPDRIAIHWGMTMAAYPFFGAVAEQTGRLLKLQDNVTIRQIQRRIREQYGERETASRAAQRILRTFVDWGILRDTEAKGVYSQGDQYPISDPQLLAWLIEASLHARPNGSGMLSDLLGSPALFPFSLTHVAAEQLAALSPRLDCLKHGFHDDVVMLRKP